MKLQIKVKTPKGQAKGTEKKIRTYILGMKTSPKVSINKDDNEILWEVTVPLAKSLKINRNIAAYDVFIKSVFDNRLMKRVSEKKLSKEDQKELKHMLKDQTTVTIVHKEIVKNGE